MIGPLLAVLGIGGGAGALLVIAIYHLSDHPGRHL